MGMRDTLKNFFRGSNNAPVVQEDDSHKYDSYKKSMLATQIVNLIDKIKRINSFDSSIWNLSKVSTDDLQKMSLSELEKLQSSLDSRLSELTRQSQRISPEREALEKSNWTGQRPKNMTIHEFDRLQRDDER